MSMKMLPALLLCSLLLTPAISTANDDAQTEQRLARMEAEIRHLQARIRLLEDALHHSPLPGSAMMRFMSAESKLSPAAMRANPATPALPGDKRKKPASLKMTRCFAASKISNALATESRLLHRKTRRYGTNRKITP